MCSDCSAKRHEYLLHPWTVLVFQVPAEWHPCCSSLQPSRWATNQSSRTHLARPSGLWHWRNRWDSWREGFSPALSPSISRYLEFQQQQGPFVVWELKEEKHSSKLHIWCVVAAERQDRFSLSSDWIPRPRRYLGLRVLRQRPARCLLFMYLFWTILLLFDSFQQTNKQELCFIEVKKIKQNKTRNKWRGVNLGVTSIV